MLLLSPSSSGPLFIPTFTKLEKETPELSCEQRVNLLCSYLIWSEDQLRILLFCFFLTQRSFILSFFFSAHPSPCDSFAFRFLSFLSCLLAVFRVLFPFLFGPLFSPTAGVIQGSGVGSKTPLKCLLLWEHFKRPFHHVHEAALETKLKYDLPVCESSILNSLESFVVPLAVVYHFSVPWMSAYTASLLCSVRAVFSSKARP